MNGAPNVAKLPDEIEKFGNNCTVLKVLKNVVTFNCCDAISDAIWTTKEQRAENEQ